MTDYGLLTTTQLHTAESAYCPTDPVGDFGEDDAIAQRCGTQCGCAAAGASAHDEDICIMFGHGVCLFPSALRQTAESEEKGATATRRP